MKTLKFLTLALLLFAATTTQAQVSVSVNINTPAPRWIAAPVPAARFYYLPDIQVYYDRPAAQFIYMSGGGWVRTAHLPAAYRGYDLYRGRTVCLTDYHGYAPYAYYRTHRVRYAPVYHAPVRTVYVREHKGHGRGHYKHDRHDRHDHREYRRY